MPDFPQAVKLMNKISIGTGSPESIGRELVAAVGAYAVSTVWPVANLAMFIPVEIYNPVTIVKMSVNNGAAVSGNIDVGIYLPNGIKIVSSGTTAQAGTSAIQTFDITDWLLQPGLYYMAVALDNTTGTLAGWSTVALETSVIGVCQMASAFVLPATATFATFAQTFVPLVTMTPKVTI